MIARSAEFSAAAGIRTTSMPPLKMAIEGAVNVARMTRIARSLAQHGFRLRGTGDGWRIEPRHTFALKDKDGKRA